PASALLPVIDKSEDFVILLLLPYASVGVAEYPRAGVLGQEGQYPLLAPAAPGDVVLLHQGLLAVEGNRVEVQVETGAAGQPYLAHGIEPQAHQLAMGLRRKTTTVLGQKASLGHDVQPGEQGQPLIEDVAHGVA